MCPTDIAKRAENLGVLEQMAKNLGAHIESVRAEAKDFEQYWTFGKGAGTLKAHWMRELRERIRRRHGEGLLKAPGLVEHEAARRRDPTVTRREAEADALAARLRAIGDGQ